MAARKQIDVKRRDHQDRVNLCPVSFHASRQQTKKKGPTAVKAKPPSQITQCYFYKTERVLPLWISFSLLSVPFTFDSKTLILAHHHHHHDYRPRDPRLQ